MKQPFRVSGIYKNVFFNKVAKFGSRAGIP